MPNRPMTICKHPGCTRAVPYGNRYCEFHRDCGEIANKRKQYDTLLRPKGHRFYHTKQWRKCRNEYIRSHPLCEECLKNNRTELATEVHHIVELADGGAPLDKKNLRALCHRCHMEITKANTQLRRDR